MFHHTARGGTIMKTQRILVALTLVNLAILLFTLARETRPAFAQGVTPVLRGRALEIVDDRGKVRASLSVIPEDPKVKSNGKPYPEIVLLRLISAEGAPHVKLGTTKLGASLVIGGESPTYIQLLAEGGQSTMKLIDKAGQERVIKP
jgi:hypothetical protein